MTKGGGPPLESGESQLVRIVSDTIRIGPPWLVAAEGERLAVNALAAVAALTTAWVPVAADLAAAALAVTAVATAALAAAALAALAAVVFG